MPSRKRHLSGISCRTRRVYQIIVVLDNRKEVVLLTVKSTKDMNRILHGCRQKNWYPGCQYHLEGRELRLPVSEL